MTGSTKEADRLLLILANQGRKAFDAALDELLDRTFGEGQGSVCAGCHE